MATSSVVAVQSVPAPLAGMAVAGNNALRQVGAVLGPAVLGGLVHDRDGTGLLDAVHAAAVLAIVFADAAVAAAALPRTHNVSSREPATAL